MLNVIPVDWSFTVGVIQRSSVATEFTVCFVEFETVCIWMIYYFVEMQCILLKCSMSSRVVFVWYYFLHCRYVYISDSLLLLSFTYLQGRLNLKAEWLALNYTKWMGCDPRFFAVPDISRSSRVKCSECVSKVHVRVCAIYTFMFQSCDVQAFFRALLQAPSLIEVV